MTDISSPRKSKLIIENGRLIMQADTELDQLDLSDCKNLKEIPAGLRVKRLNLARSGIQHLPAGLIVDEYLNITETDVNFLPEDLFVGKAIFFTIRRGNRCSNFLYETLNGCAKPVENELQRR